MGETEPGGNPGNAPKAEQEKKPGQKEEKEELTIETNVVTVAAAGTAVKIVEIYGGHSITIWADDGNTGDIFIGNRDVNSAIGLTLAPGGTVSIDLTEGIAPNKYFVLFVDAANADDSMRYLMV